MNLWFRLFLVALAALVATRRTGARDALDRFVLRFRVLPTDLDVNMHMTNSRYLALMDLGRTDLILRSGLLPVLRRRRWAPVIGGCMVEFRRPLAPFERVELATRMLSWDAKWIYIEHRLTGPRGLACRALVRGAFLEKGRVVPPAEVARLGGFGAPREPLPQGWREGFDGFRDRAA